VPNVAHLDPQRGGCCTVMPYFIGNIVEVPVTCSQDYTLFHILCNYSIDLWKEQIELITAHNGLVSILVHPDYIIESRAREVYRALLSHLEGLKEQKQMWTPLPREVAEWWQLRSRMRLVQENGQWSIEGPGKERACLAFAYTSENEVHYALADRSVTTIPHARESR
jgi:hypothetical protein